MTEIVRMTTQAQPLEVGVPLYPFSHTTLFSKDGSGVVQQDHIENPLPDSSRFEEHVSSSPTSLHGIPGRSPMSSRSHHGVNGRMNVAGMFSSSGSYTL